MIVTAQMVKELREKTGAGMLDCKKALEENNGSIDLAVNYLREKGIAKAAKKANRIAAEGLCNVLVSDNQALVYEINSETDFVAKNKQFLDLLDHVGNIILNSKALNTEDALKLVSSGKTVETLLMEATATIGEKITLRRVNRVYKKDSEVFGFYKHMGGKIVVVATLDKDKKEVAKDMAMHIAANNPRFLSRNDVDKETIENERKVLTVQAKEENANEAKPKPDAILEKIIEGRINKFLQEICLLEQGFVKDPAIKVSEYLKSNQVSVLNYLRLEVGEGIEKREENFAEEVKAQIEKK